MLPSISLVLPMFNEEGNIVPLFNEIKDVMTSLENSTEGFIWEVIYVDDASTDNSANFVKELMKTSPNVRLVAFEKNCGQSAAFQAGFLAAKNEAIVTMDSDMQNDPKDIPALLKLYQQGNDMVIGWRHKRKDTFSKRLASKIGNAVRRTLTKDTVQDTGCSLKVMRTDMAKNLPLQYMGMHRFLVSLMQMQGATVAEVPVNHRERFTGTSKYSTWGRALYAVQDLLVVNWFFRRIKNYKIKTDQ